MKLKAVIDRFEGDQAVLLFGDDQTKLIVPRSSLPKASKEVHWLEIKLEGDNLTEAVFDEEEMAKAKQRIADKLSRLRRGEHLK